jgi:hypothetical protein
MKWTPVKPIDQDKKGNIILHLASTAADDDWLRAGRLASKAEAGDEQAAKELQELKKTPMVQISGKSSKGTEIKE